MFRNIYKKVDTITFGIGSGLAEVAERYSFTSWISWTRCWTIIYSPMFHGCSSWWSWEYTRTVLASFGIGVLTDIFASGRLLTVFPNAPSFVFKTFSFFSTSSMAVVLIFSLIVIFLQFKPQGLFPQKGRTVE